MYEHISQDLITEFRETEIKFPKIVLSEIIFVFVASVYLFVCCCCLIFKCKKKEDFLKNILCYIHI